VAARGLLGARLVREDRAGLRVGRIVEVEAYGGPEDRASHARFGRTRRTASMFGQAGTAYVYGIYGVHTCLNVVTGPGGTPAAVLLRALEPVSGLGLMRSARLARAIATRRADRAAPEAAARRIALLPDADLTAGPASLAAAFDVDAADDGRDLLDPGGLLRLEAALSDDLPSIVVATPRIGVARAGPEWAARLWRFVARRPGPGDGVR
jgi:DNA-3-methyladenine glycosylase